MKEKMERESLFFAVFTAAPAPLYGTAGLYQDQKIASGVENKMAAPTQAMRRRLCSTFNTTLSLLGFFFGQL